jgi:hypothetical protein
MRASLLLLFLLQHFVHGFRSIARSTSTTASVVFHDVAGVKGGSLVPRGGKASNAAETLAGRQVKQQLLARSAVVGASCVSTWGILQYVVVTGGRRLSAVTASSLMGLLASLVLQLSPAYTVAALCGSFAGMSAQIGTATQACSLGLLCAAVFFWWESVTPKIQLGKGGRLGTIAFLSNLAYFAIQQGSQRCLSLFLELLEIVPPSTAPLALTMWGLAIRKKASATAKIPRDSVDQPTNTVQMALFAVPKVLLLGTLIARFLATAQANGSPAAAALTTRLLPSVIAVFAASQVVKKSVGVVLPVALVGLVGSLFLGRLAAPIYMGAFVGMTGLKDFSTFKFVQASLLSTTLLELGLFNGFGGRLGLFAFLGVNFAI